jgi:hypothetical protein
MAFDESKHPRGGEGTKQGGQFVAKGEQGTPTEKPKFKGHRAKTKDGKSVYVHNAGKHKQTGKGFLHVSDVSTPKWVPEEGIEGGADEAMRRGTQESAPPWATHPVSNEEAASAFNVAGDTVSGLNVLKDIPNTSSISSSLGEYEVLSGIREVPFSAFTQLPPLSFYSATEEERVQNLSERISNSKQISPLIVVMDKEGPYILEGGHRFDALRLLKVKSFPAMVVLDVESIRKGQAKKPAPEATPHV